MLMLLLAAFPFRGNAGRRAPEVSGQDSALYASLRRLECRADSGDPKALYDLAYGYVRQGFVVLLGDFVLGLVVNAQIIFERIPVEILVRNYSFVLFHCGKIWLRCNRSLKS